MRNLRLAFFPVLIWTLALLAIYGPLAMGVVGLPASDLTTGMYPYAVFQGTELWSGRLPVWSPGSYGGHPFAADPQSAVFYPVRLLTLLFAPAAGPPLHLLVLEAVFHLWLAGVFMYAFATDITGQREAGLLAAIAWGLGGYLTSYPVLQLPILETVAWLPLALLCVRRAAHAPRPVAWLCGAALALACSALAGHPQTLMHAAYLTLAYYLFSTWRAGWSWRWIAMGGAQLAGLALGLAAPVWLPALDYFPLTERAGVGYDFVRSGFPLQDYVQVLVPNGLTAWAPQYIGVGALLLAGLAVAHRDRMPARPRHESGFWLGVIVVAGLLSLGDDGLLFAAGYRLLPGWSLFRNQERWVSLFSLALAILAAMGCAAWLRDDRGIIRRTTWHVLAALAGSLALAGVMLALIARDTRGTWGPFWGGAVVLLLLNGVVLLAPLRAHRRLPRPQSPALLLLLLVVDLAAVSTRATPGVAPYDIPRDAWASMLEAAGVEGPAARVDSSGLLPANLGELYGIEDIHGVSPLLPRALAAYRTLPRLRLYQLLDVDLVLSQAPLFEEGLTHLVDIPPETLMLQEDWLLLYRNETPHARAWLVHDALVVPDQAAALAAVSDPALDPMATVVLEGPVAAVPAATAGAPPASDSVTVERVSASELHLTVRAASAGYLVISEWYSGGLFGSGWRATVDGVAAPIRRADYALQAIAVPPGEHVVRLWYAAPAVWAGVALAGLSLLATLLLVCLRGRWLVTRRAPAAARSLEGTGVPRPPGWPLPEGAMRWLPRVLLGIGLLGLALRLYRLGIQELRGDEAFSYLVALGSPRQIVASLLEMGDPHSPLHYLLLHATMAVAGVSEFAMRLPSALLGALGIPVAWGVGRVTGGFRRGLLLASLAAIAQPLVWIGQDLRSQYVLAVLFYWLATLILLRQAEQSHTAQRTARWLWVAYALCAALSVYAFYYAALALLGHAAYVLCHPERRRLLKPWLLSALLAAALFGPWAAAARSSLLSSGQLSDPDAPKLAPYILESVSYLTAGETWGRPWVRGIAAGALLLALAGARRLLHRERALAAWALTAVGATLLVLYLLRFVRATYEPRYLIVAALPWWTLLVAGLEDLLDGARRWRRWLGLGMTLALLLLNVASVTRYHTDPTYSRTAGYREAAAFVAARALPGDVFVRNTPDPCWDYYLRDVPVPRAMVPSQGLLDQAAIGQELAALGEAFDRLWFVPGANPAWDRDGAAGHWLEYNMLREQQTRALYLTLCAYRPIRTALELLAPIESELENGVTLLGHTLLVNGQPLETGKPVNLRAGDTLDVTVFWRAEGLVDRGYTAFVHLVSQDGVLLAQHDGIPLLNTRPTTYWQTGEIVMDRHTLTLGAPPTGDLVQLHIGMYDSETVVRAPYIDGGDAFAVTLPLAP